MANALPTLQIHIGSWAEARNKLKPHGDTALPEVDAQSWRPTTEQCAIVIYA